MSSYSSISSEKPSRPIGTASATAPALVDVRIEEDFTADPRLIATRRPHLLYDVFYRWCHDTTKEPQLADQQDEAVTNRSEGQQS
jgi:hypothetical protein